MYEIKNLPDLLTQVLNQSKSAFVKASIDKLTSPGENYASDIFSVDITVKNEEKEERTIRAVAKMLPQNKFVREIFKSEITFRNEVGFYDTIAPCLRQFQKEQGLTNLLDNFSDFYGARSNLENSSEKVDENAVLLIKNIKHEGFDILDRKIGFDLDQSKLILEKLAELHGTFMGLRTMKPQIFEDKLKVFFREFGMFENKGDTRENQWKIFEDNIIELIKHDDFCIQNMDKIRSTLKSLVANDDGLRIKNNKKRINGPFVSITHCDAWTNNIMVKIVEGTTVDVKFVDFQLYELDSVTRDVIFFLFTSIRNDVIKEYCDELLKHYFDSLVQCLKNINVDVTFEYGDFLDEISNVGKLEFFHIMIMLRPIFALEKATKKVDDLRPEDFLNNKMELDERYASKASFVMYEFISRGWL